MVVNLLLFALALVPAMLLGVLALECLLALLPARMAKQGPRGRVAVLMPAHNEEAVIAAALATVTPQLIDGDRVLVVADNCDDATAQIARDGGAEVLERHHETDRGKGFALAAGLERLKEGEVEPPEVVIILDADCDLRPGAMEALACTVMGTDRPAQALYLMDSPPNPSVGSLVSTFAFLVKNHVRPRGLNRLGLPVPLTGSGMAFPWDEIAKRSLANGDIVEDMSLGVDLMCDGRGACFLEAARVQGRLPSADSASTSQRTRWEHGHLQTILRYVPKLWSGALTRGRPGLLALGLDLAVPPLSLLVMASVALEILLLAVMVVVGLTQESWLIGPPVMLGSALALAAIALLLAWWRFARAEVPARALISIPAYALGKIPIYLKFLIRRQTAWVRTERDEAAVGAEHTP